MARCYKGPLEACMTRVRALRIFIFCLCLLPSGQAEEEPTFKGHVLPFLKTYCIGCHSGENPKAGISLDGFSTAAAVVKNRKVFSKAANMLRRREMPPEKEPQPPEADRTRVVEWLAKELAKFDCSGDVDPGRVTIRRLNRTEYNNTLRDLLGIDFRPAENFPPDDVGHGFDNIGDVLSLPPLLMEKYLDAAESAVEKALEREKALGDDERTSRSFQRIMACSGTGSDEERRSCVRRILSSFAAMALRRPTTDEEVSRLVALAMAAIEAGDTFDEGIKLAMEATLVSPHFLFRVESGPTTEAKERSEDELTLPLGDYALATRLSYFLWSSMPDKELLGLAYEGRLNDDDVLAEQTRRMLSDPRSGALIENFAGQWLQTRLLERAEPDPNRYPGIDLALKRDMETETLRFFEVVVREDRSVLDFIDGEFTFLNERLANHYGIEGIKGEEFRHVSLADSHRSGILTHASILTLTSNPTRTSPVKRGKWILEQILGTPPPPPPPNVEDLSEEPEAILSGSLRERMERHRLDPNCASCHARMDPIGFAFENFDGVGRWRDFDGRFPIDPSGTLPDGRSFDGPNKLKTILRSEKSNFCRNLVEKSLTYALGRGLEYYDSCAVNDIVNAMAHDDDRYSSLVVALVQSVPFRMQRGPGSTKTR